MNGQLLLTILFWVAGVWLLVSVAAIVWCAGIIFKLKSQVRRLRRPPLVERDPNGRPMKERI